MESCVRGVRSGRLLGGGEWGVVECGGVWWSVVECVVWLSRGVWSSGVEWKGFVWRRVEYVVERSVVGLSMVQWDGVCLSGVESSVESYGVECGWVSSVV